MPVRDPSADERAFLGAVLSQEFEGVAASRTQWANAKVERSCNCGCGSIGFVFDLDVELPRSSARSPLPIEADVFGPDGELLGGVIVLLSDGLLDDVDVHSFGGQPLAFPPMEAIRFNRR